MSYAFIIQGLISYGKNLAMSQVWSAMNSLQVISHMILIDMKFPANTMQLFEDVKSLVSFEIVPGEVYGPLQELMIDLPSDKFYHEQANQVGYETGYIIGSMFLTFALLSLVILRLLIDKLVVKFLNKFKCCEKMVNGSKERLASAHGEFIQIFIELCLDITICGSIEIFMK